MGIFAFLTPEGRKFFRLDKTISAGFMQEEKPRFASMPLVEGQRIEANLGLTNRGTAPVDGVYRFFELALLTATQNIDKETHTAFLRQAHAEYDDEVNKGNKGVSVGVTHTIWNKHYLPELGQPPLTKEQAEQIKSGQLRLYVYSWSRWQDEAHDLDSCRWAEPPASGHIKEDELNWHVCEDW